MLVKSTLSLIAMVATVVLGCEPECRRGVAKAFADSYAPVVHHTVQQLHSNLRSSLFQSSAVPVQIASVVPENAIEDAVLRAVQKTLEIYTDRATDKALELGIYNVMFNEQDPFKGDCNAPPRRLTRNMPPKGESWTLDECAKMDYICGNPPSICYHLKQVKDRIVGRIKSQLTDNATFDNGLLVHSLVQSIKRAIHSEMTHYGAGSMVSNVHVMDYANQLVSNAVSSLDKWINDEVKGLCDGSANQSPYCTGWDSQIKLEILKWP